MILFIFDFVVFYEIVMLNMLICIGLSVFGKDEFFKLLVVQLVNQDLIKLQDLIVFVVQLVQFFVFEQQQNMNGWFDLFLFGQVIVIQMLVVIFIGKDVMFKGGDFVLVVGWVFEVMFDLGVVVDKVMVLVSDGVGNVVCMLQFGVYDVGSFIVSWDGCDDYGVLFGDGIYIFVFVVFWVDGGLVVINVVMCGMVIGVFFQDGVFFFKVGGLQVKMFSIIVIDIVVVFIIFDVVMLSVLQYYQ